MQRYNRYGDALGTATLLTVDTGGRATRYVDRMGSGDQSATRSVGSPSTKSSTAKSPAAKSVPAARSGGGTDSIVEQHPVDYQYRVYALNEQGASGGSKWSNRAAPRAPKDGTPGRPTGLQAFARTNQATLWWSDPRDSTITGYRILRGSADTKVASRTVAENATGNGRGVLGHRVQRRLLGGPRHGPDQRQT